MDGSSGCAAGNSVTLQHLYCQTYFFKIISITIAQVDDSGHWIPQDPVGNMRKSHRILQENTRNRWNMEAVFRPEIDRTFSGGFQPTSCAFWLETAGNYWKKSEEFPVGILLPQHHRNYPEPTVSKPDSFTRVFCRTSSYDISSACSNVGGNLNLFEFLNCVIDR